MTTTLATLRIDYHNVRMIPDYKPVLDWEAEEEDLICESEITDYRDDGSVLVSFSLNFQVRETKVYKSEQSAYDSSFDDILKFANDNI